MKRKGVGVCPRARRERGRERERPSSEPERNAVTEVERRTCISSHGRGAGVKKGEREVEG